MFANKKHTSGDNLSHMNFFNSGIMHVSRTRFRICQSLIALVLIVVLLRMGALLGPMAQLIIVEAWLIALGPAKLPCPPFPLGRAMVNAL